MIAPESTEDSSPSVIRHSCAAGRPIAFGVEEPLSKDPADPTPLYRWGWLPLIGGCFVITAVVVVGSEALFIRMGYVERQPFARVLSIVRAMLLSSTLAAWAGWYVLRTRRRLEALREELLARRLALEARTLRMEQVAGLGAFSRVVAHEVRNPLNVMALQCELLKRRAREIDGAAEPLQGVVDALQAETSRLRRLVDDYIAYSRAEDVILRPTTVKLDELVSSVTALTLDAMREQQIVLTVDAPIDLTAAHVDGPRIAEALHFLLRRARESVGNGGAIGIRLEDDNARLRLAVYDDGEGFEDPSAVFRPFFTESNVGPGFGLAIARDIVRAHGGEIRAANLEGHKGACVTIWLPKKLGE